MSWLDKFMKGHGEREQRGKDSALTMYKEKLKGLVYDNEIVEELAPVFAKLHGQEGFEKVFELLETKEQQIAAISGGEWFEQQTDQSENNTSDGSNEDNDEEVLSADEILAKKYEENK